ncbi:pneumococcal serine-rich repeat protein-like [Anopheles cruzii]|uniref:pneumococcal serine-rich repeat protein-like n=1 Tax=Anopheles cruzii TaxID=68878 RepID=UPI0022EC2C47|nr:pneumococcal serine-rich repeat protein-like [Anopheles cruzii]
MDLDTMTTSTAASQEATLLAAKPSVTPEASEKDTVAGKNGSAADSTDGTGKDKALASSPAKKMPDVGATPPNTTTVPKSVEPHKKVVDSKSPAKQPSDATGGSVHEVKSAGKTPAECTGRGESVAPQAEIELEHYDELVQRMEAIEKGEDPALVKVAKKADDASHQNGMVDNVPGKLTVAESQSKKQSQPTETDASVSGNSALVGSTVDSKADAKPTEQDLPTASGGTVPPKPEAASSSAKRKLSECTPEVNEPDTKKVHIGDVTDSTERKTTVPVDTPPTVPEQKVAVGNVSAPASSGDVPMEKPPSVEKMDVDASPEPETSCSENVDTEPNTETEGEEKTEEISSSVADQSTRKGDDEMLESNSNVSSSDDKRSGATERAGQSKPPDSEVSASALPTPSEVEAMDVDMEADVDEGDLPSGPIGTPVVEPPCVKKVAYLCYDDEHPDGKTAPKPEPSSGKPTPVASTSTKTPASIPQAAVAASTSANEEKMEVDSVSKSTGRKPATVQAEAVVGSSIAAEALEPAVASSKKSISSSANSTAEVLDESVVESSQPSSSSDSKKQTSDKRLDEPLRATVHRSALLAKASSTPNTGTTGSPAATPSTNPSTPNPVIASAVSSSNVFSSTPIHENFERKPVNSGNVSKITNPSSVETSRIEADDAAEHSSTAVHTVTTGEGNDTTGVATASTTKSLSASGGSPSNPETASLSAATASTSTSPSVRLTPPKKDALLKHEHSSSGTSLKTTDSSEVDSCTVSSEMNTAEEIAMYTNNARKYNGISSTSSDVSELDPVKAEVLKTPTVTVTQEEESKAMLSPSPVTKVDLASAILPTTSHQQQYEVSIWFEGRDLQFLSIEKLRNRTKSTTPVVDSPTPAATSGNDVSGTDGSPKQSTTSTTSNGSVTSLGPFALPDKRLTASTVSSNSSSGSVAASLASQQSSVKASLLQPNVPQVKQTVIGPSALCDLMIGEFKKLKRTFAPHAVDDDGRSPDGQTPKTPTSSRGQRKEPLSGKKSASRAQKRSKMADASDEEDTDTELCTLKASSGSPATKQSTKRSKGTSESPGGVSSSHAATTKISATPEPKQFDICCLARWTDRKYYAGRVTNQRGDKYVVMFEDGCSKTLSRDVIVFGEDGVLPILNHSIHVLTGGDTYEPAIVEEVKRNDSSPPEVMYAVRTATSALEIAASGIYLTDEQAKWIHNACKNKPDPIQQLLLQSGAVDAGDDGEGGAATGGGAGTAADLADGDKGSRSTRSKRGGDKTMTPGTPEAGYSGGVGKKGRRGRRNKLPPPDSNISECSEGSDAYEDEQPVPQSPEAGLDAVDGVQPELQRTAEESELVKMNLITEYFGVDYVEEDVAQLLGAIPHGAKTLFRNKHFLLSCTIPPKSVYNADNYELNRATFSSAPFVKQHLRRQIEAGGGKVYNFFEDVPKNKYKHCKLIAPRPSTTAVYIQCLACNIVAVSHEWIAQCCHEQTLLDHRSYTLPSGWSFLEQRYISWGAGAGRTKNKRSTLTPLSSISINVASLNKDFNDFWSRVCRLGGATVRLIKRESDVTDNLSGYLLTDQEFPEEIKIKASRIGLLVVSTVWVVQCLINGRICHPSSHEKLTQIYQEDDY